MLPERGDSEAKPWLPEANHVTNSTLVVEFPLTAMRDMQRARIKDKLRRSVMNEPYDGKSTNPAVPGVSGENTGGGDGISGTGARNGAVGQTSNPGASGVFGLNTG